MLKQTLALGNPNASKPCPTAPFYQYRKTDAEVYAEGYESGNTWPDTWNWRPGGPWCYAVSDYDRQMQHPDIVSYGLTLIRHKKLYLKGWEDAMRARGKFTTH